MLFEGVCPLAYSGHPGVRVFTVFVASKTNKSRKPPDNPLPPKKAQVSFLPESSGREVMVSEWCGQTNQT